VVLANFINVFQENQEKNAIIYQNTDFSYFGLIKEISTCKSLISTQGINSGEVVALIGDFSPKTIAFLFALIGNNNIIVPLDFKQKNKNDEKLLIAGVTSTISIDENDEIDFKQNPNEFQHPFYNEIRNRKSPGLVLFTSGTSGKPKAAVHDFNLLLSKFIIKRKALKTFNFLLFDHWGGLNTMFHTLSNGGVVLALKDRQPKNVCEFIEKHKIELLPASPTFLNLLLISEEYKNYELSSLKLITYGTEPMPQSTLNRMRIVFPNVKLQQTYGLIELGVLRSKSQSDDSLWVKIGGEGFETRVVDDLLEIKAHSAMLGYLNAPSPFTEDGWFKTGDQVEVDGEYMKILGRKSEIINVGGEKVYPAEVESIIQEIENVAEVTVYSEKNPIIGNIVCAKIRLLKDEDKSEFISRAKKYCNERLQKFKVPVKIFIDDKEQFGERYKKIRN